MIYVAQILTDLNGKNPASDIGVNGERSESRAVSFYHC